MESIVEKTKRQIDEVIERATVLPATSQAADQTKVKVKVQVDASDEYNEESSNIFSLFNQQHNMSSLRVDVKIDEDVEEDPSDAIAEGGEDTVYGQGSNPKPKDETYLSLLKNTSSDPKKIKVKLKD